MDQMTYDVVRAPCVFAFVLPSPGIRQVPQQCTESRGSARQQREGMLQVLLHVFEVGSVDSYIVVAF